MKLLRIKKLVNRIAQIIIFLGIFTSANSVFANEADIRSKTHPLLGLWDSKDRNTGCKESYKFDADGKGVFTSDKEVLNVEYQVPNQPDERGFFKLTHTVKSTNGEMDCTKANSSINEQKVSYLLFQPDGYSFIACDNDDPSLETCFGPMELKAMSQSENNKLD